MVMRTLFVFLTLVVVAACSDKGPGMFVYTPDYRTTGAEDGGADGRENLPGADATGGEDLRMAETTPGPDSRGQEDVAADLADVPELPDVPTVPDVPPVPDLTPDEVAPPDVQPQFAPGHWECTPWGDSTQCTPMYETKWCGNGQCEMADGESAASCPADCDPGDALTLSCQSAQDCIFLPWPHAQVGYWVCEWVGWGQGYECVAVQDAGFCNTPQGNWCAEEWGESAASCPADCAPQNQEPCASPLDCVYQAWPDKVP